MMERNSFLNEIKRTYSSGAMHIRLVIVNAIVFIAVGLLELAGRFFGDGDFISYILTSLFTLKTEIVGFFTHPWGIITSMFAHFGFWHFAMNMLFLFFAGQMFLQFFSGKRLLSTYLLGGLFGGALEILTHLIFPTIGDQGAVVVGASGSIMAIFMALAFYRPQLQIMLFGFVPIRLFVLAIVFLLSDLFAIGTNDGTAHFAHLGGALLGYLSVRNINSSKNIITRFSKYIDQIFVLFKKIFGKKKMRVVKTEGRSSFKSDEQYALDKKINQAKIDAILDKISRSGYDSLSKQEKDFLFKQSGK
jgi:membrane associated rhomboid family serine protease